MNLTSKTPKISVIMPVYNTEKYVAEALHSIIDQSFADIEIIVINDGSTDNSLQVVNDIAQTDSRIQVYSKENDGPSGSRNMGMQKASGDYIYFMDSDDILEQEALKSCYEKCESENLNFVFFDADVIVENNKPPIDSFYSRKNHLDTNKVYSGYEILEKLIGENLYRPTVWLCLIKREILVNLKLTFYPQIIHEDELFVAMLHLNATRVGYLPFPYFRRRIRENSITTTRFQLWNVKCYITVASELKKYATGKIHAAMIDKICSYILNPAIYRAAQFSLGDRINVFKQCQKNDCLSYISLKNLFILFFPFTIKLKSQIK